MAFANYVYATDQGVSFQIRIDIDQATVAGAVAGASDFPAHVKISTSRRSFGIQPRHVVLRRVVNPGANQRVFTTRMAVCTEAVFDAMSVGGALTVNGTAYTISSKVPELYR